MSAEIKDLLIDHAQADVIAERAVRKVFAILGVDVDRPELVEEFRAGLRFSQQMRRATDKGYIAVFIVFCVAIAGATWAGIVSQFVGGHGR